MGARVAGVVVRFFFTLTLYHEMVDMILCLCTFVSNNYVPSLRIFAILIQLSSIEIPLMSLDACFILVKALMLSQQWV
jgi:hypothetical protein